MAISLADIQRAQDRIGPYLTPSMLEIAPELGAGVYLKLENTNPTHSFKIRGALNAALALDEETRNRGVVTASSGNHAQALAYAAHVTQTEATILVPEHTPQRKMDGVRRYGIEPTPFGATYDETEAEALRRGQAGLTFISAYNHPDIIAGAGTVGLEILSQATAVDRVIVPVSGGGLISGVALALKASNPNIEVIGVNAVSAPSMYNHYYGAEHIEVWDTLAEALSGAIEAGSLTLDIVTAHVDQIVMVSEAQIARAMRWMIDAQGWIVEGGGAVGAAALLDGVIAPTEGLTVVVVSGGNVGGDTIRRIL